jgi:hypothetical protein
MTEACTFLAGNVHYELRFTSLSSNSRGYAFPCDRIGHVDLDELTDRGRTDYFYARTVVGKELCAPVVERVPNGA